MSKHARLTTESTLTTPCDRNTENKFKLDGNIHVLNENESEVAIKSFSRSIAKILTKIPILIDLFP